MSSIDSLKLTTPVLGESTYTSPITDLLRYNSLSYSAFYIHASLLICNVKVYFSNTTADEDFKLYSTITLDNEVRATGNLLIPSRYVKFSVENPAPDPMEDIDVVFNAHKTATSNIDVNLGADDITISGMATETTQVQVKNLLDDVKLNTTRVKTTDNVADAIPVRLVAGINGDFYNPLRAIGNDLSIYVDNMNADVALNSGLSTKALQEEVLDKLDTLDGQGTTQISYLTSIDSKITEVNTADVSITSSVLPTGGSTSALQITGNDYLNGVVLQTTDTNTNLTTTNATLNDIKLDTANLVRVSPTDNNVQQAIPVRLMVGTSGSAFNGLRSVNGDLSIYVDDMNADAVNNSGMAKASLQTDGNSKLDDIKSNTDNLVRVAPTDNNVQQAIPVRLMVGTSGSAFNALRSVNGDLSIYVDDMNADAVNNSGMAKASLQTDGNNTLTTISNTLTTMDNVLDDISLNTLSIYNLEKRTFNLPRSSIVLHNSVAVSADTTSTQFIMGDNDDDLTSKDIYNTIQLNGRVPHTSSYSCVLEFSSDGTYWFSDHIEPNIKRLGTSAYSTFSLTRTNICSRYARVYHLQGATELFLQASLMRY